MRHGVFVLMFVFLMFGHEVSQGDRLGFTDFLGSLGGNGAFINGSAARPREIMDMAESGQLVSIRNYGSNCLLELKGEGTDNLVIDLQNDNGRFNRAEYRRVNRSGDSGVYQGSGDFFAGMIFNTIDPDSREMRIACRVNSRTALQADPCVDSGFGAGSVLFTAQFGNFGINQNRIEEITGAASLCCQDDQCVGQSLLAIDRLENPRPSLWCSIWGCGGNDNADQGTE